MTHYLPKILNFFFCEIILIEHSLIVILSLANLFANFIFKIIKISYVYKFT